MAAVAYKYGMDDTDLKVHGYNARGHKARAGKRRARLQRWSSARLALLIVLPLFAILSYVGLTAELTAQTYRLAADQSTQAQLLQSDDELRQRLAQLQSVAQLESAAARLGMKEPARISVITLPAPPHKAPPTLASRLADLKHLLFVP